jgi:hypothetical protein
MNKKIDHNNFKNKSIKSFINNIDHIDNFETIHNSVSLISMLSKNHTNDKLKKFLDKTITGKSDINRMDEYFEYISNDKQNKLYMNSLHQNKKSVNTIIDHVISNKSIQGLESNIKKYMIDIDNDGLESHAIKQNIAQSLNPKKKYDFYNKYLKDMIGDSIEFDGGHILND